MLLFNQRALPRQMLLRIESAAATENSALKQASLSHGLWCLEITGPKCLWTHIISSHRCTDWVVFRTLECLPYNVFKLSSLPDCEVLFYVYTLSRDGASPAANWSVFLKLICKSLIWDQKTFSHQHNFTNGGTPQMLGWATVYLKCSIGCTVPTTHYLFCFPGKVHSEF